MKEILDVIVWAGFIYILFIFLRGMNENQVEKHKTRLEESVEKENKNQTNEKDSKK
jgi:threonine/homoserine/homoserine lactone efflux protein